MFIEINNLKKSFGSDSNRVEVLRGVDFSIEKGDICVLLGPSGSGKSTLLNIIGGIDDADAGYISIGGERMADMNEKKLTAYRRKHLSILYSHFAEIFTETYFHILLKYLLKNIFTLF